MIRMAEWKSQRMEWRGQRKVRGWQRRIGNTYELKGRVEWSVGYVGVK